MQESQVNQGPQGPSFLRSIKEYFSKRWREALVTAISGPAVIALLLLSYEKYKLWDEHPAIFIIISLNGLLILLIDFFIFRSQHNARINAQLKKVITEIEELVKTKDSDVISIIDTKLKNSKLLFRKTKKFNVFAKKNCLNIIKQINSIEQDLLKKAFKTNNQLLNNAIMVELSKQKAILESISNNNQLLPCLQHFEFLREYLKRALQDIMREGDHYITLASVDFWTLKPFKATDFFDVNLEALNNGKIVDRVMIVDKRYKTGTDLNDEEMIKFNDFKNLISELKREANKNGKLKFTYTDNLKFFFYFIDDYDEKIRNFLDSVLVCNENLNELMFIKVKKLSKIANASNNFTPENPSIETNFFKFNSTISDIKSNDIISVLQYLIKNASDNAKQLSPGKTIERKQLSELSEYLLYFIKYFEGISSILNIQRNEKIETDLNKTDIYDIEMLSTYYNNLVKANNNA